MIKFVVSSHIDYFNKTRGVLEASLLASGVAFDDIKWCVFDPNAGGYLEVMNNVILVPHNSLDYTGLVSVLEMKLESPYWFALHDTSFVGKDFYTKLLETEFDKHLCVGLSDRKVYPGCSMGVYSWEFIQQNKDAILEFKNTDNSTEGVAGFKTKLVRDEDKLFADSKIFLHKGYPTIGEPTDFYNTGVKRRVEHYKDIDLYKVKANWSGFSIPWVIGA